MLALVTGGAGFIGSHTVDLLLEKGYSVRILDNLQPRVHPRGRPAWVPSEAEFVLGDAASPSDLGRALEGVTHVFHLAAYQDYLTDFSTFIHTNTVSTALLFELIVSDRRRYPVEKIVFASSQSVSGEGRYVCVGGDAPAGLSAYRRPVLEAEPPSRNGGHGLVCPGPRPLEQLRAGRWELECPQCGRAMLPLLIPEAAVNPHTAYAISKYAIELLAERLGRRYGIPTVCLRYTYVQGPRNSFYNAYSGVARRFALSILNGLPPTVYEDGRQLRDYVNVKDVARANLLALERDEANYRVFNVGGGRAVTVLELAGILLRAAGSGLEPLVSGAFRVGDTRHTVSDISAMRALGWQPAIPVEQSMREYLEWLSGQPAGKEHLLEAEREMRARGVVEYAPGFRPAAAGR